MRQHKDTIFLGKSRVRQQRIACADDGGATHKQGESFLELRDLLFGEGVGLDILVSMLLIRGSCVYGGGVAVQAIFQGGVHVHLGDNGFWGRRTLTIA